MCRFALLRLPSLPILLLSLLWSTFILPALSQSDRPLSKQFQWKFTNDGLAGNLPTCVPLGILVQSWDITLNDTFGIPPYYMISYEIGATAQTQFIGTNNRTLNWTVSHPPGSKLMLSVVDSTQSSGGIPSRLFNVVAGSTTDCVISTSSDSDFTVTANATEVLNTCEPWGLTIKGGVQPYSISLPAVDSPVTTNLTVLPGFDHFTYINRASPGSQLLAAVSDSTGRWAYGSPLVMTKGKSDVTCRGLDSSSGIASVIEAENAERNRQQEQSKSRANTALIAGVTVPVVLLALGGIAFAFWFLRRKKQRRANQTEKFAMGSEAAQPFDPHGAGPEPSYPSPNDQSTITPFDASTVSTRLGPSTTASAKHMEAMASRAGGGSSSSRGGLSYTAPGTSSNASTNWQSQQQQTAGNVISSPLYDDYTASGTSSDTSSNIVRRTTRPSFAAFPTQSTRNLSGKAAEAAAEAEAAVTSPDSEYAAAADEIVIQHRDGGVPVIRELPPPYMDASGGSSSRPYQG